MRQDTDGGLNPAYDPVREALGYIEELIADVEGKRGDPHTLRWAKSGLETLRAALAQEPAQPYVNPEGNTCTHHPDDPAHGPQCVYYPELSDAECDAAITKANMDAHEGPFVPISELTAQQLWKYYRAIYRAGRRSAA